jgi:predicted dienelactone hydrolase
MEWPPAVFHPESSSQSAQVEIAHASAEERLQVFRQGWLSAPQAYETQIPDQVPTPGRYTVRMATPPPLQDPKRSHRPIPYLVYYPANPEPQDLFPVVLFSHGMGGSIMGYGFLGRYWASHGYVVIHPTHAGSDFKALQGYGDFWRFYDVLSLTPEHWLDRPHDVSFLIDQLPSIEQSVPTLAGHLDKTRIGAGGHSYGAYTTLLLAGARVWPSSDKPPMAAPDERIRAFLAFSPQGQGRFGLTARSWMAIHRPVLQMSGSQDFGDSGQPPLWRKDAFDGLPADGRKWFILLDGASHFSFVGRQSGRPNPPLAAIHHFIQRESLLFWDAWLKDDPAARAALQRQTEEAPPGIQLYTK